MLPKSFQSQQFVFLPGWGFSAQVWQPFVALYFPENSLCLDLPPLPKDASLAKQREVVREFLYQQIPQGAIVCGWSLGGLLLIDFCQHFPTHAAALILIGSTPKFIGEADWPGIALHQIASCRQDENIHLKHFYRDFLAITQYPNTSKETRTDLMQSFLTEPPENHYLNAYLEFIIQLDLREAYQALSLPLLHVFAERDAIVPALLLERLPKKPNVQQVLFDKAGHALHLTDSAALFAVIKEFTNTATIRLRHTQQIRHSFNKAWQSYDRHATLQHETGQRLIAMAKAKAVGVNHIVDLGCGTGVTTEALLDNFNYQSATAIDIADKLLAQAKERLKEYRVTLLLQDFNEDLMLATSSDLIFANMSLHWSVDLSQTLSQLYAALTTTGVVAISIPLAGTFQELAEGSSNTFFTNAALQQLVTGAGFDVADFVVIEKRFEFTTPQDLLRSIKALGANYLVMRKRKGLLGKTMLNKICQPTDTGAYVLTYRIGLYVLRKGENHA